jgi:Fe-S oxidoreductase
MIVDLRRYLVGEAQLRGSAAQTLQKLQRSGNPWGLPAAERTNWASGLKVPTVQDCPDFELLYWVGCAAAYDRRAGGVARAVVRLLQAAGVKFAVLGGQERCSGETARRMGDEFLFQELAAQNVEQLQRARVRRIVTHCPHCLNSLRHDYPQFAGQFEVLHHSELLAQLLHEGRLPLRGGTRPDANRRGRMTYHDPCYLARLQGQTEAPRALLTAITDGAGGESTLQELPRNRRDTACCGAGGGRMWFDDAAQQRVGVDRIRELTSSGAQAVAVACPFCLIMISDGLATQQPDMVVRDIAEWLADDLEVNDSNGP